MKKIAYLLILLCAFVIQSCKKEPLPELPEANDPFYTIRGLVDGDSIDWIVGLDDNTITYGTGSMNGVKTYYGQINAGTGDMAIRIEVIEPELLYNGSSFDGIKSGKSELLVQRPGEVKFNFGVNYSQFNYLLIKNENNIFEPMNSVDMPEYGIHNITLKFTDFDMTESFDVPVRYGFEYEELNPSFQSSGAGDTLIVTPEIIEGDHQWYINDELISAESTLSKKLPDGIYKLKHVLNQGGNKSEYTTLIRMRNDQFYWQMKYYYLTPDEPENQFSNVLISMYKDGQWYTSETNTTNTLAAFLIDRIAVSLNSQLNVESVRFSFDFDATLINENQSDSLSLEQMIGSINVGIQ